MDKVQKLWVLSAKLEGLFLVMKSKEGSDITPYMPLAAELLRQIDELMQDVDTQQETVSEEVVENAEFEQQTDADEPVETAESEDSVAPVVEPEPVTEDTVDGEDPEAAAEKIVTEAEEPAEEEPVAETPVEEEPVEVMVEESVTEEAVEVMEEPAKEREEVVRVEDKVARLATRDIHKAFNLNDMFRFRRALFGNSTAQYNEALDLIAQMDSYDETADYFIGQYGWNPEDDSVKSFLTIVKKHFEA